MSELKTYVVVLKYWDTNSDYPGWSNLTYEDNVIAEPQAIAEFINHRNQELRECTKKALQEQRKYQQKRLDDLINQAEAVSKMSNEQVELLGLQKVKQYSNDNINRAQSALSRTDLNLEAFDSPDVSRLYRYHPIVKYSWEYAVVNAVSIDQFKKLADRAEKNIGSYLDS